MDPPSSTPQDPTLRDYIVHECGPLSPEAQRLLDFLLSLELDDDAYLAGLLLGVSSDGVPLPISDAELRALLKDMSQSESSGWRSIGVSLDQELYRLSFRRATPSSSQSGDPLQIDADDLLPSSSASTSDSAYLALRAALYASIMEGSAELSLSRGTLSSSATGHKRLRASAGAACTAPSSPVAARKRLLTSTLGDSGSTPSTPKWARVGRDD